MMQIAVHFFRLLSLYFLSLSLSLSISLSLFLSAVYDSIEMDQHWTLEDTCNCVCASVVVSKM